MLTRSTCSTLLCAVAITTTLSLKRFPINKKKPNNLGVTRGAYISLAEMWVCSSYRQQQTRRAAPCRAAPRRTDGLHQTAPRCVSVLKRRHVRQHRDALSQETFRELSYD